MSRLLTTRRSQWLPGVGVLGVAVGMGAVLGFTAGARQPPLYLMISVALLMGFLLTQHLRARRPTRTEFSLREEPPPAEAAVDPPPPYDLAGDRSTDDQKYVM